jgi:hypothetical protein
MACIYEIKPESCSLCLVSGKLQCLLNNQQRKLTEDGKKELISLLKQEMKAERRSK